MDGLTSSRFAAGWVIGAWHEALDAEAVEATVRVDAPLGAGVRGGAFVHIHTRLPIMLQVETRMTAAL